MRTSVFRLAYLFVLVFGSGVPAGGAAAPQPAPGELVFAGDVLHLELLDSGLHPRVNVDVGDGKRHAFIVDTAAPVSLIDSAIAEERGYEVVGEIRLGAPGGSRVPASIVKVPLARVGMAEIRDADFVAMDLASFSGGDMQGVLGLGLFREYLLTFDYRGGEIRVERGILSAQDPGAMHYQDIGGHIHVDMQVAGASLSAHIDTGSAGGFTLPVAMKDKLPLKEAPVSGGEAHLVGGNRKMLQAQLDGKIVFAGTVFGDPRVTFLDPSPGAGNIGSGVLSEFLTTIDQKHHLIRFERAGAEPSAQTAQQPRRLGLIFRNVPGNMDMTIGEVVPGSLAEQAGLAAGDKILTINGKVAAEYDMSELGALFRSTAPLSFDVERDGRRHTVAVD